MGALSPLGGRVYVVIGAVAAAASIVVLLWAAASETEGARWTIQHAAWRTGCC